MEIETRLFGPPPAVAMADMEIGDIGQFDGGSYLGETVIRTHAGWFTLSGKHTWLMSDYSSSNKKFAQAQFVRLLQLGDVLTIRRTA